MQKDNQKINVSAKTQNFNIKISSLQKEQDEIIKQFEKDIAAQQSRALKNQL